MSERIMGPDETFLEIYLEHHYRKAKKMQARARALGITPDQLTTMVKSEVETVEFKLNILEEQKNVK